MKTCSVCKQDKVLADFYTNRKSKDGKQHRCKSCAKTVTQQATKRWRKTNKSNARKSNVKTKLKLKYGKTLEQLVEMLRLQDGKCKICKVALSFESSQKMYKPHVDHDHKTGYVRGILCLTCNTGLGMFMDSSELLSQAINYLSLGSVND